LYFDAHFPEVVYLVGDDCLGQAELGDAIDQHAAGLVQGLEYDHIVSEANKVRGACQSRGPRADDCHLPAGGLCGGLDHGLLLRAFEVPDEAFQVADGDGLAGLPQYAEGLALGLLGQTLPQIAGSMLSRFMMRIAWA